MTLVATLSPSGCPIMLGDLLLSGARPPGAEITLPTIGKVHLVDESVTDLNHVAWLAPKICTITQNLAVGWAGDYTSAKRIISSMRNYSWPRQLSLKCIREFLATTDYDDQAAISMAGIFATDETFGEFGLNSPQIELPLFNQCRILGNGRQRFIDMCLNASDLTLRDDDEVSAWTRAVATALGFTTALIGEEINNYGGLKAGVGGFFEVLSFNGSRFEKLDDVLYCFWSVPEHDDGGITISPYLMFIKVKYEEDVLIVRRVEFVNGRQSGNDVFITGPTACQISKKTLEGIRMPRMISTHNCHYVAVRSDASYEVLPIVEMFANENHVHFEEGGGVFSFHFHQDLLAYIHDRVIERFYNDHPRSGGVGDRV